jgi:hypothetical protein
MQFAFREGYDDESAPAVHDKMDGCAVALCIMVCFLLFCLVRVAAPRNPLRAMTFVHFSTGGVIDYYTLPSAAC